MGILPKNPGLFRLDGQPFEFEAFDFLIAPPGSRCELEFWGDPENMFHLMAIEFPESKDDIFALPIHSKLGEAGAHWDRLFRRGLNRLHLTKGLVSTVAVGILWSVAQMDRPLRRSAYVEEAERLIEAQHGRPIRISDLARQLGISQSQLNRQFVLDINRTPLQFVQDRRATYILNLLRTTVIPIKQIATDCGFPDVHSFSRFVSNRLGGSPRAVRLARTAHHPFDER